MLVLRALISYIPDVIHRYYDIGFNDQTQFGRGLGPDVKREIIGTL